MNNNNNNRNSSSSFNNIQNAGGRNNRAIKSNTQSTFDIFNINVADAQNKITKVFNFTQTKVKENERFITKSIDRIYAYANNKIKQSGKTLVTTYNKAFKQIEKSYDKHMRNFESRLKSLSSNTPTSTGQMKIICECNCCCGNGKSSVGKDLVSDKNDIKDSTNKLSKIGSSILKVLGNIAGTILDIGFNAAKAFASQYETIYNQVSTSFASDNKGIYNMVDSAMSELNKNMKGVVNYTNDFLPALEQVSKQGLMGDNAVAKAIRDSIDKKIMPWLDTNSEQFVNMNTYLSESNINAIKGQQLSLQKTEAGNRLLQSGVINSLTNSMEPLLRDIDFNTGGATNLQGEAQALMESLVEQQFTPQEAFEQVQRAMNVQKNQGNAILNGSVEEKLMGITMAKGGGLFDAFKAGVGNTTKAGAGTGSDLGASLVGGVYGNTLSTQTLGSYQRTNEAIARAQEKILQQPTKKDYESMYDKQLQKAGDFVTPTQKALNNIENTSASIFGLLSTQFPMLWTFLGSLSLSNAASSVFDMLGNFGGKSGKIFKKIGSAFKKGGSKIALGISKAGAKISNTTIGKAIKSGATKVGSKLFGTGARTAVKTAASGATKVGSKALPIIGSVLDVGLDAGLGVTEADNWFGKGKRESTTSEKIASGIGGAIGGSGPGIGQGSVGEVASNIGLNALKGGGIGATIGSFILPGIGTAIGGAIGAGAGALWGAIGGERIAKAASAVGDAIGKGARAVGDFACNAWDTICNFFGGDGDKVAGVVSVAHVVSPVIVNKYKKKVNKSINDLQNSTIKKSTKVATNTIDGVTKAINDMKINSPSDLKAREALVKKKDEMLANMSVNSSSDARIKIDGSHASGLDSVPYDGYIAKLHKGESVFNRTATRNLAEIFGATGTSVNKFNTRSSDVVSAIEIATTKIVNAILSDKESSNDTFDKIRSVIGKFKINYDNSVVDMQALPD